MGCPLVGCQLKFCHFVPSRLKFFLSLSVVGKSPLMIDNEF